MRQRERGFTLIEIMVVMVIVGVMVGMITLVASGNRDKRELENEARRLIAVLQMAADEAVMQNVEIGLELTEDGYSFRGFDEKNRQWIELPQRFLMASLFPPSIQVNTDALGPGFELRKKDPRESSMFRDFGDDDDDEENDDRNAEDGDSQSAEKDEEDEQEPFRPQILMLSSGETTPFSVTLSSLSTPGIAYKVVSDGVNPMTLEVPADEE